jgi:hypothetical protein
MVIRRALLRAAVLLCVALAPAPASAQAPDASPAFSLASDHIFASRERPTVRLMFRRVPALDFRIYRVRDPLEFFARLRDPHVLGSEKPLVPQERTWLERLAIWKSGARDAVRTFLRSQLSHQYRHARNEAADRQQVQLRRVVAARTFTQVPLLNPSQLVASWREVLPLLRDTETRRIPLDLHNPGVYVVEAVSAALRAYTIVVISDLGIVSKGAQGQVLLYVANRFSGEPVGGCDVRTIIDQKVVASGTTAADGTFEAGIAEKSPGSVVAVARCGNSVAVADPGSWVIGDGKARDLVGYVYTDRPIYRPGHTVNIKSVLRWRVRGALQPFDGKQVELSVSDNNDKVLLRQPVTVNEFGTVHASFTVPANGALGSYAIRVTSGDETADGTFEVQDYRKPEFDVRVAPAEAFAIQGGRASFTVNARYYFGQPVPGARVKYIVRRQSYYSPFRWSGGDEGEETGGEWYGGEQKQEGSARLDEAGNATIPVPLDINSDGRDYALQLEAQVTDASGREVSGRASVNAIFARFLLVVTPSQYLQAPGTSAPIDIRAMDYAGQPQAGVRVGVSLEHVTYKPGEREPVVEQIAQAEVATGADGHATWQASLPARAGSYRIRATTPVEGRQVQDTASVFVTGPSEVAQEDTYLEMVSDRKTYRPGETARLMVRGAQFDVPVLVTKETRAITYHQLMRLTPGQTLDVPVSEADIGGTYVNIAFLKDDRFYRAEKRVDVSTAARELQVSIAADPAVSRPGQPARFTLEVKDADGRPARAEMSVGVVDEALYGVTPDHTPDATRFFHRLEYSRVGTEFSREYSFIGYSGSQQLQLAQRHRPLSLADFKADRPSRPDVRRNFPDAILWMPDVVTDASGTATIELRYPDSLTTWRMTVRAVTAETHTGAAINRTITTKDLIVRVITPRFLTEGDESALPVVVHNYLPAQKDVAVETTVTGLTPVQAATVTTPGAAPMPIPSTPAGSPGGFSPRAATTSHRLTIASGGDKRVDQRFKADKVGRVTVSASATTDGASDAAEIAFPVLPFGVKRIVSMSGSIAGAAAEATTTLTIPERTNAVARTVRVGLAPSMAGALLGALDFLTSYPYGCTEQTLSSFIPNLVVLRALAQMKLAPAERLTVLDRQVSEGLRRLYDYQHDDGGFGWWKTDENDPFMTAYALEGMLEAKHAGYDVDVARLMRGREALERLYREYPRAVPDLKAYVEYALERLNQWQPQTWNDQARRDRLEELWNARGRMSNYGRAVLLLALQAAYDSRAATLEQELLGAVKRQGELAWWPADTDAVLFEPVDTSVEATSLAMRGLVVNHAKDPVLEQAARWLLVNRNGGYYWSSTKQTATALYGLLDYMRARGEQAAPFTVDVFVNDAPAGSRSFTAADLTSPNPVVIAVPGASGENRVKLVKRGAGTLYWSAEAQYYQTNGRFEPTGSRKLAINRLYFTLAPVQKNGSTVYREVPFTGTAQPGDVLAVRLTVAGATDWRHLMIEDPLPGGAEPIRQQWLYPLERAVEWAPEAREYRDDRVVFFQQDFDRGRYEYVYLLKVVTPGRFKAMPAQIAPMYVPGVSASSNPQGVTFGVR